MDWFRFSWPTLILLGLAMRMALRLTYGARGPEPGDPMYIFLIITSWVLIAFGVMPAVLGGVFAFFGVIIGLLAATTFVEAVVQQRIAQRRSVCRMLALLVEHGGQLETSVLTGGQSMRGIVGRAANRLFDAMRGGTPIGVALVQHSAALPSEAAAYLAAGPTRAARLAALRELSRADQGEMAAVWRSCVDRVSYLVSILVIMAIVLAFLMIKIVPAYHQIFQEFGMELPAMTYLAINLSNYTVRYLAAPIFFLFVIMSLATIIAGILYLCDMPALGWLSDRVFRGKRTADVLRILALATEHRQPLTDALYRISRVYPSPRIRRQLHSVTEAVNDGADWRDALLEPGIINKSEHSLLRSAEQVGNLPWALRAVAKRREKRIVYRLAIGLQVVYPMIILLLGAFVGFFCVALFFPLVKLIHSMV
jgi:type II secretory pathway component PulF